MPAGAIRPSGLPPFAGMSTVWKPVGTNLTESPTWIVVPCGKKSLTSANALLERLLGRVGVPMSTVFVAALALAGDCEHGNSGGYCRLGAV